MNGDQPRAVFGQRGRGSQASAVAHIADEPASAIVQLLPLLGWVGLSFIIAGGLYWTLSDILALRADTSRIERKVTEIVNQPITHLPRSGPVAVYSPGWFHSGAITPDFDNVDIRDTQELIYKDHVTSNLNPSEMFIGSELEFNKMTKYFYTDLTLPKKRLSDAEMSKINNLYRLIGKNEQSLFWRWLETIGVIGFGAFAGSGLLLLSRR